MFSSVLDSLDNCTNTELDARLRRLELQRRQVEAEIAATVAVASKRLIHLDDGHHSTKSYLRATCNWSNAELNRVTRAAQLVDTVPGVGDGWFDGRLGSSQVHELATARAHPRVGEQLAEFAPLLLEHAEHLPFDDFRVCVRRFMVLADVDGSHRDADAVEADRAAHVRADSTGVDISVTGGTATTAAEFVSVYERFVEAEFERDVEARRTRYGDDALQYPLARTAQHRRHDAIHAIFLAAVTAPADGRRPEPIVNIVVDQRTFIEAHTRHGLAADGTNGLLGPTDLFGDRTLGDRMLADADDLIGRRCETSTGLVVHPDQMLRAAFTGYIRRLVVDGSGVVVDMGRLQRLFTGSARTAAQLLVRRCGHPGCQIPTSLCDIDHMQPWAAQAGRTDQHNGDPRCNPHDRHKHRAQWRSRRAKNGRVYSIRADGTAVLPVGERCPEFYEPDDDPAEIARLTRLARARCSTLLPHAHPVA